jgi:hypothetical protein
MGAGLNFVSTSSLSKPIFMTFHEVIKTDYSLKCHEIS